MKSIVTSTIAAMVLMVLVGHSVSVALALTTQTINFGKLDNKMLGAAPFTITVTASSGLPVTFVSTTPGICTVSGSRVTLAGAGTCTIRASQAGNSIFAAAPNVDQSMTVFKANQSITFATLADKTLDATPITVSATASSGLPVTFTSITAAVCTIAGAAVTLVETGTCTIRATQSGNANYNAAVNVHRSFTVTPIARVTIQYTHDAVGNLIGVQRVP